MNTWLLDYCEGHEYNVEEYSKFLLGQLDELVSNYGKVYEMWFDHCDPLFPPVQLKKALDLLHRKQPEMVVNNRGSVTWRDSIGDFVTPERHLPETLSPGHPFVECCDAIGINSWGFKKDESYWSAPELIRRLCRSASYGGNYLLNVGPRSDGTISPEFSERMGLIGEWLKTNRESIFGTGESYLKPSDAFAPGLPDIGCSTRKGKKSYLHLFNWPAGDTILIKNLKAGVKSAHLLGSGTKLAVSWQEGRKSDRDGGFQQSGILLKGLPPLPPSPCPAVVEVDFNEDICDSEILKLNRKPTLAAPANESVYLLPDTAELKSEDGISWHKICRYQNGRSTIGHMITNGLECLWSVSFAAPGKYRVIIELGVFEAQKDAVFEISIGREKVRGKSAVTGWYDEPGRFELGLLAVSKGLKTVKLRMCELPHLFPDVHRIILLPSGQKH